MADDDARSATRLQERLEGLGGTAGTSLRAGEDAENNLHSGPWRRLQRILRDKRDYG
jgi:hypothetical protein